MNRRSFITTLLAGCVAPLILPGAGRNWKKSGALYVPNPMWQNAEYEVSFILFGNEGKQYNFGPQPDLDASKVFFNETTKTWYERNSEGLWVQMDNVVR